MTICLFVGGCIDGERREVPDEWAVYNATPPIPAPTLCDVNNTAPVNRTLQVHRYVRVNVVGALDVFVYGDPEQLLAALIWGYRSDKGQH